MKKLLSILLALALCFSVSVTAFAADLSNSPYKDLNHAQPYYDVTLLDETGNYTTYTVDLSEGATLPVYQVSEAEDSNTRRVVQTATLTIGVSSGNTVFYKFTPTLSTLLLTLGFTGSFSVTGSSGLSHGTYYEFLSLWHYVPGPAHGGLTLSGTYYVIGYSPASIFQHVRY